MPSMKLGGQNLTAGGWWHNVSFNAQHEAGGAKQIANECGEEVNVSMPSMKLGGQNRRGLGGRWL